MPTTLKDWSTSGHDQAFDDDVRDAVLAWVEAGCPRGGLELVEVERTGLALERAIIVAEDSAGVVRKAEHAYESKKAVG